LYSERRQGHDRRRDGHPHRARLRPHRVHARGDRLSSFKAAAALSETIPEEIAFFYRLKHEVSIRDMITDIRLGVHHPVRVWEEKISDSMNYLVLLEALVRERYDEKIPGEFDDIFPTLVAPPETDKAS
jgi:hypothetical protein